MRENTCCFTGHRLHKLPWGANEQHDQCLWLRQQLSRAIAQAAQQGITHFISGMAQGVDLWAAEAVLALKPHHAITLEAALPFAQQSHGWHAALRQRHEAVLLQCDRVTIVSPAYHPGCFDARNRYMVAHSGQIIAVYGGGGGGTRQTLALAKREGLNVVLLNPADGCSQQQLQLGMAHYQ